MPPVPFFHYNQTLLKVYNSLVHYSDLICNDHFSSSFIIYFIIMMLSLLSQFEHRNMNQILTTSITLGYRNCDRSFSSTLIQVILFHFSQSSLTVQNEIFLVLLKFCGQNNILITSNILLYFYLFAKSSK